MTTPLYRLLPALTAWWVSVGVAWANYDEYMTCGSGSERYGRHYHHPDLPCDLSKESWCESPGNQYPWRSVRRFVYENQGLMKRMYGNQRHYSVLRAELLNDLYDEMFDEMIKRPHHHQHPSSSSSSSSSRSARYRKPSHPPANSQDAKVRHKRPHDNARAMKVTFQHQYSSVRRQHAAPSPKTRPKPRRKVAGTSRLGSAAQKDPTTTTTSTATTTTSSSSPTSTTTTTTTTSSSPTSTTRRATTTTTTSTTAITSSDVQPTTTTVTGEDVFTTTTFWGEEDDGMRTASSHSTDHRPFEEDTQATLLPPKDGEWEGTWTTISDPSSTVPSSAHPTAFSESEEEEDSSYPPLLLPETSSPEPTTTEHDLSLVGQDEDEVDDDGYFSEDFISTPLDKDDLTTLTLGERLEDGADFEKDEIDIGIEKVLSEDKKKSGNAKRAQEQVVEEVKSEDLKVETREQVDELRVDGNVREEVKVETTTPETFKIKRPVKERLPCGGGVCSPLLGQQHTRGNLGTAQPVPFEQYIQWERCKHEHRQWYCRRGCRCEQQYRLHRLLAFDPTNECRGIFSDWFRFPSFCVCKCYDLPMHAFTSSQRMGRLNQDDDDGDYDEEYDDYFDDEEEDEDFELEEEDEEEEEEEEDEEEDHHGEESDQREDRFNKKEEEENNNSYYYPYRSRPSSPWPTYHHSAGLVYLPDHTPTSRLPATP